ncbi:MAG: hypothetical protein WBP59_04400 [Ilumatobacteraceae bacterium]
MTVHSSWRGIITNSLGALLVLGGGLLAVGVAGWTVFSSLVVMVGVVLCVVVAFDYPVASTFDVEGVTRRMLLRRSTLEWQRVAQLSRTRPGVTSSLRKLSHGGLVAVVGRRRYLLADRCESLAEFEAIESVLVDQPDLIDMVPRPVASVEPSWLYRRSKWAPDRTARR